MNFFADEWEDFIHNCGFTDSENAIISLIRRGWYGADIAAELNLSLSTVNLRKRRIRQKILRYKEKA